MNLKRLAEISPIVGSFLIFIGYLKLHIYYNHWGIKIAHYLDFSEITLSFLNDTNTLLFFIIVLLLQMTVGVATIATIDRKIKQETTQNAIKDIDLNEGKFSGILPSMEKILEENHKTLVLTVSGLTIISIVLFFCYLNLLFLYITFCLSIQLLILILDKIIGIKDEKTLLQTSFVIVLLGFTYCLAKYDIRQTEISAKQTILQTSSNEIICSDRNFIFIGKTNNFYIFFDKQKKQSTVIQAESISKTTTTN